MHKLLLGALLVLCSASGAFSLDTFIYTTYDTGRYGNFGPTGFVGPDGISRVICYSRDPKSMVTTAYIYRVTVPEGTDPDTHPDNPAARGEIAPRTFVLEHAFKLGVDGYSHSEFHVADRGATIYFGPAYGIHKYVFNVKTGQYEHRGVVAPPAPSHNGRPAGTLAYDKRARIWYAGSFSYNVDPNVTLREVWKYKVDQGPDGKWELAFTYTSTRYGAYHDGMEMVNGLLYLADNVGAVIYEYTPEGRLLATYPRAALYYGGEGMEYAGMGYGALQHFWYGSPATFLMEFGGGLQEPNLPPDAEAGPAVSVTLEALPATTVPGSVTDPDGGSLLCRWLHENRVLKEWSVVADDGSCPLPLANLPFGVGSYTLTLEGMDDMGASDSDQTTVTVVAPRNPPVLKVVTTPDNGSFLQGGQASYRIEVSNPAGSGAQEALSGSQEALNVQLKADLSASRGLSWTGVTVSQGACTISDNRLNCSLGSIPAGERVVVLVSTPSSTPAEACQPQPVVVAHATAEGGLSAQDSGSLSCTPPNPRVELVKVADVATAIPGQQVTYSYTVKNTGNVPVSDVSVKDDNGTPYLSSDDFVVGSIATLAPGAEVTLTAVTVPSNTSIVARLGAAGPSLFTVLSLGSDPSLDLSGIYCAAATVNGNVGIIGSGYFHNDAACSESGDFYKGQAVEYLDLGGQLKGRTIVDDAFMYNVRAQVFESSAYFASLPVTGEVQTQFPADGKLSTSLTVTGKPGLNVVRLPAFSLSKGYLTLDGPPGTQFVLNISGSFNLNTGNISTAGGVGPFDVIYNVTNAKASVGVGRGFSGMVGILLAPYNEIHAIYNRIWDGQIIGGYNRGPIKLNYDTVMTATDPPPPTVTNTATASCRYGAQTVTAQAQATVLIK
jgi:uncharacterized repeat protein (TIGR01451 family)